MMKKSLLVLFLVMIVAFLLQGCGGNNGTSNVIHVNNNIESTTTWNNGKIYVIDNDIVISATLTIQPGAIIKLKPQASLAVSGSGAINATGLAANPIIFTAFADDNFGGDTDANGGAVQPTRGYWREIYIETSGSTFDYCKFFYGGDTSWGVIGVRFATANISHCTFAHNDNIAVHVAANAEAATTVTDNIFYDNETPLSISTVYDFGDTNVFHNPDNVTEINDYNGIWVTGDINETRSWGETEVPFVVGHIAVGDGITFNLANDVIIKFLTPESDLQLVGNGADIPNLANVTLTSYKDDVNGGDTNHDNNATSPSNGDWDGIWRDIVGTPYIHGANILYAAN